MREHGRVRTPEGTQRYERTAAIGSGVATLAQWSLRLIVIAGGTYLVGFVIGRLWVIVLPVVLALILATVLWPPVAFLRRKGWPPALAALTVVLGALAVLTGIIALITPPVADQIQEIAVAASDGLTRIQDWLTGPPLNLSEDQISAARESLSDRLQDSASVIASGVVTGVTAVGTALVGLFIVLLLTFFFVKDGPRFLPWLRRSVGERAGRHLDAVLRRCWRTLGGFIRSQAAVGLIDAVLIGIGLLILGVPLVLPLMVLTFFGGFIPIVGAFIAGALSVLVALVTEGPTTALIVLVIVFAVQQIEGNVLQPMLQSRSLRLHEGVILLAVAAGSSLYGVTGAFLAVPIVAIAAEVFRYLGEQLDDKAGQAQAREPEEPEEPGEGERPVTPAAPEAKA
ncbi:MAG: AI-2E family transporter [Geodermatophilaceae bacterium]|nr:AI-2E family transporter [Geodermatophilaceae bacterium]